MKPDKSNTAKAHAIDLNPILDALADCEKAIAACDENDKAIDTERTKQSKNIDAIALEDIEALDDAILDEARREVRLRIRSSHQAKLCENRREAANNLMGAFLDLQGLVIDSANREMWELKAKLEEALQPVIVRYSQSEAVFLESAWPTILDPYHKFIFSVEGLDNSTPEEDRNNRHGFYRSRSKMLIRTVEEFNRRGAWLSPERELAAA